MLHTYSLFKCLGLRMINKYVSRYTKRNDNTPHDVIFDVIKPNDAGKIACPMNRVQHIFNDSLSVSMDINLFCIVVE